ncbi:MAG TPA: FmdB family zinc ribbon protein [Gammaproteobacteria bacterium]
MPDYVYRCAKCGEAFERTERMSEHGQSKPECPKCKSRDVHSVPASFFAKTSRKS